MNITDRIEAVVKNSGVREGIVLCNAIHIAASAFIDDEEAGLKEDFQDWLEHLAPSDHVRVTRSEPGVR